MKSKISLMRSISITQGGQQIQTTRCGEHSFKSRSINAWNLYKRNLKTDLITCDFPKFKKLIFHYHLN